MQLHDVCHGTAAALNRMDLSSLMHNCKGVEGALDPTKNTAAVVIGIVFAILAGLAVMIRRLVNKDDWWKVVLESLEAVFFGAIGGYAGAAGGVVIAELAPPLLLGTIYVILAAIGLVFAILAAKNGDGKVEYKVFGFFHFLTIIAGLAILAAYCFLVPTSGKAAAEYQTYLLVMSIGLGILSGINAIYASVLRGLFYVIGAGFLVINGTWAFIGNILGLMTHFASMYFYMNWGSPRKSTERIMFVCYQSGFSLKSNAAGPFAFTEGAVMCASGGTLRGHEGVHVVQHYLFGPIYLVSHFVWFIAMVLPGIIGGLASKVGAGEGVTRMSYYDNPWEVMAYGIMNPTGRNTSEKLIWGWVGAVIVCVLYILAATAAGVALLAVRLG